LEPPPVPRWELLLPQDGPLDEVPVDDAHLSPRILRDERVLPRAPPRSATTHGQGSCELALPVVRQQASARIRPSRVLLRALQFPLPCGEDGTLQLVDSPCLSRGSTLRGGGGASLSDSRPDGDIVCAHDRSEKVRLQLDS